MDLCDNYRILSGGDRAQGSALRGTAKCDRHLDSGWYRFQGAAGDRMADKCVPEKRYGTLRPIWFRGNHPTVDEGVVTREACYHYPDNCCKRNNSISVKNCSEYFVYKLKNPLYCYIPYHVSRYCGNGGAGKLP